MKHSKATLGYKELDCGSPFVLVSEFHEDGRIKASNYRETRFHDSGQFVLEYHRGVFNIHLPDMLRHCIKEMHTGKDIVISLGYHVDRPESPCYEVLFDDHSDNPFLMIAVPMGFTCGTENDKSIKRIVVYNRSKIVIDRPCYFRVVESIPCMAPWGTIADQYKTAHLVVVRYGLSENDFRDLTMKVTEITDSWRERVREHCVLVHANDLEFLRSENAISFIAGNYWKLEKEEYYSNEFGLITDHKVFRLAS